MVLTTMISKLSITCSTFVSDAWYRSTGEYLSPYGPYSNSSSLKNSIVDANVGFYNGQLK